MIAATNRDVHAGEASPLRQDLFYRLAAFEIALPPLRERVEDIPLLAERFLKRATRGTGSASRFTAEAMAELCRRRWPGNVRQLRHAVEHGALLARGGRVAAAHLPPPGEMPAAPSPADRLEAAVCDWADEQLAQGSVAGHLYQSLLSRVETPLFETVLASTSGNRAAAADTLGIHRATLRKKLSGGGDDA